MKRILILALVVLLSFSLVFAFTSCDGNGNENECSSHTDANKDKKCDNCGKDYIASCTEHKDNDADNKCDYCGADITPLCTEHKDEDKDKKCDECGADFITECTEHNDTDADNKCDYCGADTTPPCTEHKDEDKDKKCDECGADFIAECTEHNDKDSDGKCDYCDSEITAVSQNEAVLIEDGIGKFNFVVANGLSGDINMAVSQLMSTLDGFGVKVERLFDKADNLSSCEVLIGEVTSRGESFKLDSHFYGSKGYAIKLVSGKVVIVGGSEEALNDAIDDFTKKILGITKKTKKLTDVVMTEDMNIEVIQDDYSIKDVMIAGVSLREFDLVTNTVDAISFNVSKSIRQMIYEKTGIWLEIIDENSEYSKALFVNNIPPREASAEGFEVKVSDGNMMINCGFPDKFESAALAFVRSEIVNSKNPTPLFIENYRYNKIDVRNIYYADFGAVGDGSRDDFKAIKAAHDYANKWGNTVHAGSATGGAKSCTYYFGKGSGSLTIDIKTDTYWHGCSFIFDDSTIKAPPYYPGTNTATGERGDDEFYASIFAFPRDKKNQYYGEDNPIGSLKEGDTNVGWEPGELVMLILYNRNIKHFIRYGLNQNNGSAQHEILLVHPNGDIDPTTPVQWTYEVVSSFDVIYVDDTPVTLYGADNEGEYAHIDTIVNSAPSHYTYYQRNIHVERSNVTITGLRHTISEEELRDSGAPYAGFISVNNCNNVVIDRCNFQNPKSYNTIGSANLPVGMGSYEITASLSNNVTWQNCTQSNFFEKDGSVKYNGMMGTNYCKNLFFDNVFMCSFDAHCGTYNATLKNSTCEHLNFIGEGTITLENMTMYSDGSSAAMIFRSDYGSTWEGNVIVNGLDLKYARDGASLSLVSVTYTNHDFGYLTHLPEKIEINNFRTLKYTYEINAFGERVEEIVAINEKPLYLYKALGAYKDMDISNPNADLSRYPNDRKACTCEGGFNDTDGDGLCNNEQCSYPETVDKTVNINPYMPTEEVYITNCSGLTMIFQDTPQFRNMKVFVEGKEVDWQTNPTVIVP